MVFILFYFSDPRVWQSVSGHEWDYPPVFPSQWRGRPLSHLWGKDFCRHLPLPGGSLQDHQASQGFLHGCGWCGTKSKDEPAERTEIQVCTRTNLCKSNQISDKNQVSLRFRLWPVCDLCLCFFRSAKEAEDKIKKALDKGEVLPTEARFDSNCITPGMKGLLFNRRKKNPVVSKWRNHFFLCLYWSNSDCYQ